MARNLNIICDLCGATPANPVTVAVNGLPPAPDGGKRKSGRRPLDLCEAHAERFDLGVTGFMEDVKSGIIELPDRAQAAGHVPDELEGGTVDLTEGAAGGTPEPAREVQEALPMPEMPPPPQSDVPRRRKHTG